MDLHATLPLVKVGPSLAASLVTNLQLTEFKQSNSAVVARVKIFRGGERIELDQLRAPAVMSCCEASITRATYVKNIFTFE
jgi:hypothetical protein